MDTSLVWEKMLSEFPSSYHQTAPELEKASKCHINVTDMGKTLAEVLTFFDIRDSTHERSLAGAVSVGKDSESAPTSLPI